MKNIYDYLEFKYGLFFFEGEGGGAGGEAKIDKSAQEVIDEVADKVEKDLKAKGEGGDKEDKDDKDDKDDKKDDDDDVDPDELDEDDLKKAKQLFKVLNNPETAMEALKLMAKTAGKELKDLTAKEEKAVTKTIKDKVKETLGKKYEFLADDLGDLLQKLFDENGGDSVKEIKDSLREKEADEIKSKLQTAYDKVLVAYDKVDDKVLKEVIRIQKDGELVLGPKVDPEKYFRAAFNLAAENLGVTLSRKAAPSKKIETTTRARSPLARLNNQSTEEHKSGLRTTQVKSLDEIIKEVADRVEAGT